MRIRRDERSASVRRALGALLVWLLASAPALPQAGPPPANAYTLGAVVSAIELRLDAPPARRTRLESLIAIRPGQRLQESAVRRTLSNLQATGLFSEIEIFTWADPRIDDPSGGDPSGGDPSGGDPPGAVPVGAVPPGAVPLGRPEDAALPMLPTVTVVVAMKAQTWVRSVELAGDLRLEKQRVRREIVQREASPLDEGLVLNSVYALQDLYFERGFRQAEVRVEVAERATTGQADLTFHFDPGPRAVIGAIRFEGDIAPYQRTELADATRLQPGTTKYGRERVTTSVQRLRSWLAERGHLAATVEMPRETYDPSGHRIDLVFPLELGPRVQVEILGASRRSLERKGLLPFLADGSFDEASMNQYCERIENDFQRKGHYRATVTWRDEVVADGRSIVLEVQPGKKYSLNEISFVGNVQIPSDQLLALMAVGPRSLLRPASGRLITADLEEDLDNLRSFYLLQGFSDVEIETLTVTETGDQLALEIEVREGARHRLVDFTFSGVEVLDLDTVRAALPLQPGGPFHPVLLDDSINIIRALYEDDGFPSTTVEPTLDWNADRTLVDVHLAIDEGAQAVVDRVILRGQQRIRDDVLQRFIKLDSGDPISHRRLLEVERDLYRLGIFSKVDVEQRSVAESGEKRDVVVRLEEGRRYRLAYGFSYHSDDGPGGLLSVTRANIGGRGDRLQFELRGTELDSVFRVLYDQPRLWRWNVPITYSVFGQTEDRDSFLVQNLGAQVAVTKDFPAVRLRGVVEYRKVTIEQQTPAFDDLDPNDILREDREVEIFSLIPIFYADRRDDPLDPDTGWSTALQLEYAVPLGNAETHFLKLFWQQTHYQPLGRYGSLAASWRLGAIEPLDLGAELDPLVPEELPSALVPASERFFAGGRTSHRAYDRDQLGISGQTLFAAGEDLIETGGNGLAMLNLDYRFPISGPVGGVVFFDYGNVWADWTDIDLADFKPGAGLGVRYRSPIGPVRLEIGWKLDPEPEDDTAPVFFLSFGNPF
ncbi:MAG: POTRA domain-containing protein [Acidobacteriota bacterium]